MRGCCRIIFGLLILGLAAVAPAAQAATTISYVTSGGAFSEQASRLACERAKPLLNGNLDCLHNDMQSNPQRLVALIEDSVAKGVNGLVVEAEPGTLPILQVPLKHAIEAGIPVGVWSDSLLLEDLKPLSEVATTQVGVSGQDLASQMAITAVGLVQPGKFCIINMGADYISSAIADEMSKRGFTNSALCAMPLPTAEELFGKLSGLPGQEKVDVVLMPLVKIGDEFAKLNSLAASSGQKALFITGWADSFEAAYGATTEVVKATKGEQTQPTKSAPPAIQISDGGYCQSCDCNTDARCKKECARCQQ